MSNGVSNITEKILADARSWVDEQLAQGKTEADAIKREYAAEAQAHKQRALAEAQEKAESIGERAKSQGEMERRKLVLATKQAAVDKAFAGALKSLVALTEEERALLMVRMVLKYQTGDAELIFNAADQATLGPAVVSTVNSIYTRQMLKETFSGNFIEQVKKLMSDQPVKRGVSLSKQVGKFAGGFILKEGAVEQNCTFEVLVNAVHDELEGEVSSILFQ